MLKETASICFSKEHIIEELQIIRNKYDQLKIMKHLQYDNDQIKQLKMRINALIHYPVSLKIEMELMKMNEFEELTESIRLLDFQFTYNDEFYWSKQLQYENSLRSEQSSHHRDYIEEIKIDLDLLSRTTQKPIEQIAFIGSGPLPMTSITLLNQSNTLKKIINIDSDHQAIQLSKSLIEYNGLTDKMDFIECLAEQLTPTDIEKCQIVLIAILVGPNRQSKIEILKHLYNIMSDGMIILVRTGRGLKQILFPPIDMIDISNIGFKPILEFHPYGKSHLTLTKLIAEK